MNQIAILLTGLGLLVSLNARAADSASSQLQALQRAGAGPFSAAAGEALWLQQQSNGRSCSSCHGRDPNMPGKHQRTGKPIAPMSTHANPDRFTQTEKTEKWFRRNCRWTLGRECSAQEKGDVILWLSQQQSIQQTEK